MKTSKLVYSVGTAAALFLSSIAFGGATKTYQVTGPVLESSDTMIAVQKGKERWEVARDASTKVTGELKVGEKVTITYTMTATTVEAKGDSKASKASTAASPAAAKK